MSHNGEILLYVPESVPEDPEQLTEYLRRELLRISGQLETLASGQIDAVHAEPNKQRDGMIRYADGSDWNPGHGEGLYVYFNGLWYPMGVRQLYGSMYTHNASATLTLSVASTDRTITGLLAGPSFGITLQDTERLVVSLSGVYAVKWSLSFAGANPIDEIEAGVVVGSTLQENTTAHRTIGTANDTGNMGGVGYVSASAGQTLALVARNESGANNIIIDHVNFTLEYVDKT